MGANEPVQSLSGDFLQKDPCSNQPSCPADPLIRSLLAGVDSGDTGKAPQNLPDAGAGVNRVRKPPPWPRKLL
jgi:hypothetical protein